MCPWTCVGFEPVKSSEVTLCGWRSYKPSINSLFSPLFCDLRGWLGVKNQWLSIYLPRCLHFRLSIRSFIVLFLLFVFWMSLFGGRDQITCSKTPWRASVVEGSPTIGWKAIRTRSFCSHNNTYSPHSPSHCSLALAKPCVLTATRRSKRPRAQGGLST